MKKLILMLFLVMCLGITGILCFGKGRKPIKPVYDPNKPQVIVIPNYEDEEDTQEYKVDQNGNNEVLC